MRGIGRSYSTILNFMFKPSDSIMKNCDKYI